MVFFAITGGKRGRLFSLWLWILAATYYYYVPFANGQQVGVSLKLRGVTIPNNSLVEFDDILYTAPGISCCNQAPTNANGLHDQTLVCVTDLVDCCQSPRTVRGNWYHPDGYIVTTSTGSGIYRSNRGQNEIIGERQFYGSVRIFRSYTPLSRGRFRCELPSAADPNITQTLYAYIVNFGLNFRDPPVTISPSGSSTIGWTYSLMCSATLNPDSTPLPNDVPSPTFEWFFGPNNSSLPSGVTPPATVYENSITYTSTLQFSPLSQSHAGMYTCQLGPGRLASSVMVTVNDRLTIMAFGSPTAGDSYTLECSAGGSEGTFQWLVGPPDGRTPVASSGSITVNSTSTTSQLQFRPIQQSNNGSYSCNASIDGLPLLSESVDVNVNVPSVSVQISDGGAIPTAGEHYRLICGVSGAANLNPTITYQWTKNSGDRAQLIGTHSNSLSFSPLRLSDAANYACTVTTASSYLTGDIVAMDSQDIRIQIPTQSSITLTSSNRNSGIQIVGSDVTLTCTIQLNSAILSSEIFLLVVEAQLSRDGTPLALTGPTVTGTTITYTAQLSSFGRSDSGNYTCNATIRPQPSSTYLTKNETLSDALWIKAVSAPPVSVRATQSNSSAPVEVSWSPSDDEATIITGYRIFYGSGQSLFVTSVTVITLVGLKVDGSYVGQNVSIRSEADQIYSELINVSVTHDNSESDVPMCTCSCSSEVGIAVGVMVCLVVMVITVIAIVVLYLRRKKSLRKNEFVVSANMAYGEVNMKPGKIGGDLEYENPDKINSGQWTESTTTTTYETICDRNPTGSRDESVCGSSKQQQLQV